ncbi:hypothetical protein ACFRMN_35120 [Streptomyces sp. NPDC056835]|uniref:hypothetical protein n=1 Tax=Streptomyces sp. NPDC056835 TaxID=3345956 RepID=UPI00369A65D5
MPKWTLHHGDALTLLPQLDIPVDAVTCDPPYNSGGRENADPRDQRGHARSPR